MINSRIAFGCDIDDVIADADRAFRQEFSILLGRRIHKREILSFRYEDCLGLPAPYVRTVIDNVLRHPAKIKPVSGAVDSLRVLSHFCRISLFTGRNPRYKTATEAWLGQYQVPYDDLIFNKQRSRRVNAIDWYVEDDPDFAQRLACRGIHIFLFSAPWNSRAQSRLGLMRVDSWEEIVSIMTALPPKLTSPG